MELTELTPGDLRAEIGRTQIPIYQVASRINMHPSRLSTILNEKRPLTQDLARRIAEALKELSGRPR